MSFYPSKINERFLEPANTGKIESPSATGASGSFICGSALKLFLQIEDGNILSAKFQVAGCGFLLAAADALCERIENEDFAEIGKIVRGDGTLFEADFENQFPIHRAHCLELCFEALRAAINDYRVVKLKSWNGEEALICTCFGVSETQIETAIEKNGLTTVEEVTDICQAGGGCGSCQPLILEILDDVWRISI